MILSSSNHQSLRWNQNVSATFVNIGCFTNIDGEGSKYVTIKTNSRFLKLFCVNSNLVKTANVGEFHWSWILGDRSQVWTGKEKLITVCLFSRSPLAKKCTKKRATDAKLEAFCFLTLFSLLSPSSLLKPPSIIDVCKLLGIRMRF